ncbi:unnamed protein product [Chilo suppressalis]|uniref:BESS domain-containing protein n=1 Tax=Chilo suppressalis TaxID=168631 RepID=A0ABN8AZ98_CHISP|nr:unnamed protein product [Chilo suppressalis]
MREVKKMKTVKSGSGAFKTSSYIHYNRLQFVQATIADNDTESSFDADNTSTSSEVAEVGVSSALKSPKSTPRKELKISSADERFASILEQSIAQKNGSHPKDDDDEDKMLCLSLVKEIKKNPEYRRLQTKIGIYNLILQNQNILQGPQHQTFENQYYRNPVPQRRNYLSQEQRNQASVEDFQHYQSQQSSVPNNLAHYGYTTAMGSPVTHTPSPAPTVSSASELERWQSDGGAALEYCNITRNLDICDVIPSCGPVTPITCCKLKLDIDNKVQQNMMHMVQTFLQTWFNSVYENCACAGSANGSNSNQNCVVLLLIILRSDSSIGPRARLLKTYTNIPSIYYHETKKIHKDQTYGFVERIDLLDKICLITVKVITCVKHPIISRALRTANVRRTCCVRPICAARDDVAVARLSAAQCGLVLPPLYYNIC